MSRWWLDLQPLGAANVVCATVTVIGGGIIEAFGALEAGWAGQGRAGHTTLSQNDKL